MEQLKKDIVSVCDECFKVNNSITLTDCVDYTCLILESIYDKKIFDKLIFKPFVRQIIAYQYINQYGHHYNNFEIIDNSEKVKLLLSKPLIPQRSPEWYTLKDESIGASEASAIWGDNPYCSLNNLILKKCGYNANPFDITSIHCQHGIKYEPIIQQLYCDKHNTILHEFGSIKHPELDMVSASPDGITPTGVMIEIKAPLVRVINGIPPKYYWYQMQQQLQVCNLDKVDFVECKIVEYDSFNEFKEDVGDDPNKLKTQTGVSKGVLIEYNEKSVDNKPSAIKYVYPQNIDTLDKTIEWMIAEKKTIDMNPNYEFNRYISWHVDVYSECEVWRDDNWWKNHKQDFVELWKRVIIHRKNGYQDLMPKPKTKRFGNKVAEQVQCLIEDDYEDSVPKVDLKNYSDIRVQCLIEDD